jgi:hypothetical protein
LRKEQADLAAFLRMKAAEMAALAGRVGDPVVVASLRRMSAEFVAKAAELERGGDRPGAVPHKFS